MKIFIDIPRTNKLYGVVRKACEEVGHKLHPTALDASYVVQAIGVQRTVHVDADRLILLGNYAIPQTVPANALLIDYNTGMVQMPSGHHITWKHYTLEFLPLEDPLDKSL